jgi:hypothetical protein
MSQVRFGKLLGEAFPGTPFDWLLGALPCLAERGSLCFDTLCPGASDYESRL